MGANEGLKAQQNHIDPIPAIYALKQQSIAILDDELAVVLASDGALYMSVPTICIALGINIRAQLRRIQRTVKLAPGLRHLVLQTRGGPQRSTCLTWREIPVWLAGIRLDLTLKQVRQKPVYSLSYEEY